jgi:FixJ family two-component response regulator
MHGAVLDNDPSVRTALGRFLNAAGMAVDVYDTSDQLFASVALKCADCLLLDLQMPGMSGLDVLKYLGQRHIRIPTIIITAHDDAGARSDCLSAGAIAFLSKPLDTEQLVQTINRIFESSQPDTLPSPVGRRTNASHAALSTRPRRLAGRYSTPPAGKITRKIVP